jgi:dihydrofolate reductase
VVRKIVAGLLMSLDGVVEAPDRWGWSRYMNEEMTRGIMAGVAEADAVLLGRRTYEQFAQIWPGQSSDVPMADFLNNSPKYVVSNTLRTPLGWRNSNLLGRDIAVEVTKLKALPGKNILIPGSPTLICSLLNLGLLDQLNLNICPLVVGTGVRLFDSISQEVTLRLVQSIALSNGVLGVTYEPASESGATPESFPSASSRNPR